MTYKKIPASRVLDNAARRDILAFVAAQGGRTSALCINRALGFRSRETLANHARLLVRAGLMRKQVFGRGSTRRMVLSVIDHGQDVLVADRLPAASPFEEVTA